MNIAIILIILLVGAIITYCSGNRFASKMALLFSIAAGIFSVAFLLKYGIPGTTYTIEWLKSPNISFALKADGLAIALVLLTTILTPIIIITTLAREFKNEKLLYTLILFMEFAMVGCFLSSDALLYYVFWEMSLIPIYFIIVIWGNDEMLERRKAAMTFFLYTFAGSLFMLAAIIFMYTKTGSFLLHDFYNVSLTNEEQIWVFLAFFLAYAIKIPIFPFHTWQAGAYQKAPTVGTMLLAGLMSKMGAYSIIRWQLPVTPYAADLLRPIVLILCIIGVIYGAVIALRQDNLKRFFAYASLSHVGMVAAGAYALTYDGLQGAVMLILAHGFAIVGLFYATDIIYNRTGKASISQLGGIKAHAPKFTTAFFLSVLASVSIPLTFNFVGEFTIMYGLYQVNWAYALFIGLSLFLGAFFMLRMYQYVMLGEASKTPFRDLSHTEIIVFSLIVVVLVFFGIYSTPIADLVSPSLREIVTYINR